MTALTREQTASREKVLLTALLLSTPGVLVTAYAAFSSQSTTQSADFIRRSIELVALFISWWVFRQLHQSKQIDESSQARLERTARLGVAGAMGSAGIVMLVIALARWSSFTPGGAVTMGLIIAFLGVLMNGWFWRRYTVLANEQYSSVIAAQQRLYRAKTLVDLCVVCALAAVVIAPFHPATPYVDLVGSIIVAGYLLWNGLRMAQANLDRVPLAERRVRAGLPMIRFLQAHVPLSASNWLLKQSLVYVRLDAGVMREAISAAGVPCQWIIPENSHPDRVLLYLHGGGFVLGLTPLHLRMGAYLAQKMSFRILMVDYRLAPDHPFPVPLDDCIRAYRWLLEQGTPAQDIVIAGDSAGGNMTIAALLKLRDDGDPLPAAAACLSPVIDLAGQEKLEKEFKDPLLPPKAMRFYSESYVGNSDPFAPLISPAFGDLRGLPPLLVHAGEDEILLDDAIRLVSLAKAAGVEARLEIYPRMWHVWQLNLSLPQAEQSLDDIAQFLGARLGVDSPWSHPAHGHTQAAQIEEIVQGRVTSGK